MKSGFIGLSGTVCSWPPCTFLFHLVHIYLCNVSSLMGNMPLVLGQFLVSFPGNKHNLHFVGLLPSFSYSSSPILITGCDRRCFWRTNESVGPSPPEYTHAHKCVIVNAPFQGFHRLPETPRMGGGGKGSLQESWRFVYTVTSRANLQSNYQKIIFHLSYQSFMP